MRAAVEMATLPTAGSLHIAIAGAAVSFALGYWACKQFRLRSDIERACTKSANGPLDVLALIKNRRSIFPKDYTGEAPPRAHIELMLEASNWAPTHGKTEPWRFVVLEGDAIWKFFARCSDAMKERHGAESDKFRAYEQKQEKSRKDKARSAYIIAICMKRQALPDKLMPEWEEVAATSCAVHNMHLMATALGVASYWSSGGPLDHPLVLDFLGLKGEGDRCLGTFYVGKASDEKVASYRKAAKRIPIGDKVQWHCE